MPAPGAVAALRRPSRAERQCLGSRALSRCAERARECGRGAALCGSRGDPPALGPRAVRASAAGRWRCSRSTGFAATIPARAAGQNTGLRGDRGAAADRNRAGHATSESPRVLRRYGEWQGMAGEYLRLRRAAASLSAQDELRSCRTSRRPLPVSAPPRGATALSRSRAASCGCGLVDRHHRRSGSASLFPLAMHQRERALGTAAHGEAAVATRHGLTSRLAAFVGRGPSSVTPFGSQPLGRGEPRPCGCGPGGRGCAYRTAFFGSS
jgi:hypothetical protein